MRLEGKRLWLTPTGLKATITVVDYDYKITAGNHESSNTTADSGTLTQLTIGASF